MQRRIARRGYFTRHFACHPIDPIALECLSHVMAVEDLTDYVADYAINARLLAELARERHRFQREETRLALVGNPKTPSTVVLHYVRLLRRESLRRLADSRQCHPIARTVAQRVLEQRGWRS